MATRQRTRRPRTDPLSLAVSREILQALAAQAYERAYESILKDPDVQRAVDELIDRMIIALRKRRNGRGSPAGR